MDLNPTIPVESSFAEYRSQDGIYDEYVSCRGSARGVWDAIGNYFDRVGTSGIEACDCEAKRLVRESSANFQITGTEPARPWQLAVVPLVLDSETWTKLDSGLQQRTRLLEAVLNDLLGQQRLLKERVLPAELLFANPEFSRAYQAVPSSGHRLTVTATDLARDNDGTWWVAGDRTRAPSGLGYALENRVITSRVLPQLFRRSNVTRLASFFSSLQQHFHSLAPHSGENPRIALLTPGEESYRYIEDAYLARYLGYTLVQGRDLAVRGNRLNLKTLGGLLPIEVLWRHISDRKCDPLELDPDSTQGVSGLLHAIRTGSVAVANSIGSSLLQMPALLPFLPSASRFLLSEDLDLPSISTYWCGGAKECQFVLEHLNELVVRTAFTVSGARPLIPAEMSDSQRQSLIERIKAAPHRYVAQYRPARSTTPVWHDGRLHSWHVALRSFQVQTAGGVDVLPGGLVRVSPEPETLDHSPTTGRLGQDCWVVADQPVDHETTLLAPAGAEIRPVRGGAELPSRVAENLFWLGRYAERAEAISRVLRTTMVSIAGENAVEDLPDVPRLIAALAAMGQIEPDYAIKELGESMPTLETVLPDSVFDRDEPGGLQNTIIHIVEKTVSVRDRISRDAYRIINRISEHLSEPGSAERRDVATMIERVSRLITDLLALSGLAYEGMTRTHGWRFLQLGRRIERAYQTSELLSATLIHAIDDERPLLESVLRATDSLMTYRSRYLLQLRPVAVIDLLVTDETNPRSLLFQLQSIDELIDQLPTDPSEFGLGPDQKIAEQLLHLVRMSDPAVLSNQVASSRRDFSRLLERLLRDLPRLSDAIAARYLIHTGTTQELTGRAGAAPFDKLSSRSHPPSP